MHKRVHESDDENRPGLRIVRGLRLVSYKLGLIGQADVVEFYESDSGTQLSETNTFWQPFPVEYKRGKPKKDDSDKVQLCAQALCLEEMLQTDITSGAFFYGRPRRRTEVQLDETLRQKTCQIIASVHELFNNRITPKVPYSKKCDSCSLNSYCMPKTTGVNKNIDLYLSKVFDLPYMNGPL